MVSMNTILWPMIALVALTAIVWLLMYIRRLSEVHRKKINPQDLATSYQADARLEDVTAAENFRNLLETPILFYVLCLALYVTEAVSSTLVFMAWVYVALRLLHSVIHVTSNHVVTRWMAYVASTLNLFVMWVIFAMYLMMH